MKKVAIITLVDDNNYGNRLQNYALQQVINKFNIVSYTLNKVSNIISCLKKKIKIILKKFKSFENYEIFRQRKANFQKFNNFVKFYNYSNENNINKDDFFKFIVGSDQILSPLALKYYEICLTKFIDDNDKVVFYAPSIGVSQVDDDYILKMKNAYFEGKVNCVSVREEAGQKILSQIFRNIKIEVLVDPTMLLTAEEWDKVSKKPIMLKNDKYILNYFLGNLSEERRKEIDRVAKENNCEVINILDKESPFYECGPSEFLYLEKNAFLICTDSFHSSVFGILYNTPFLVFEREDNNVNMNSRLDTLLSKFKLEDRRYKGKITKKDLKCDYTEAYKILDRERIKSMNFLKKALDIKDSDRNE